ncbi:MAG TPA: efflux RND transporter periplasmic adaptor subunit [Polyangiales bacterium]|nr:efflux RND transporter periplasmic adaptor subunit [Polyangiales bacterium]
MSRLQTSLPLLTLALSITTGCQQAAVAAKPKPAKVIVQKVEVSDVPIFAEFVGTIDGFENAEIRARTPGYIEAIHYKEGTAVKKGDLLFTLDPILAQASLTSATGSLEDARAAVSKADADVARLKPLLAAKAVSQQEYDDALSAQQAAKARVLANQGSLQTASANLSYTKVRSPINGIAGLAKVRVGNLVGQSEPTLLTTVSTLDPVRVRFAISENQYLQLATTLAALQREIASNPNREGHLELILADGSIYPKKGKIAVIERQIDIATGTLTFEALFPNPDSVLRPGQFAKVRGQSETKHGVVLVPQRAVRELQGSQMIGVIGEGNKLEVKTITATSRVGSNWVVEKGLKAGDRVVVEGLFKAKPGDVVEVEERAAVVASAAPPELNKNEAR